MSTSILLEHTPVPIIDITIGASLVADICRPTPRPKLSSSRCIYQAFKHLTEKPREEFWALYMDATNTPIAAFMVSLGIVNASLVHPREVFAPATISAAQVQHGAPAVGALDQPLNDLRFGAETKFPRSGRETEPVHHVGA